MYRYIPIFHLDWFGDDWSLRFYALTSVGAVFLYFFIYGGFNMTEKQPYQSPLLEVHTLSAQDVICSSFGEINNELEWDWNERRTDL